MQALAATIQPSSACLSTCFPPFSCAHRNVLNCRYRQKAFDSIGGGLNGRLFERQVPVNRLSLGRFPQFGRERPSCANSWCRAPRDSQDSFISSPLMGSQVAISTTIGGSLSRCAIRACGMLAGVTSVSAQNPCGGCEHPACPNVLVPTLAR